LVRQQFGEDSPVETNFKTPIDVHGIPASLEVVDYPAQDDYCQLNEDCVRECTGFLIIYAVGNCTIGIAIVSDVSYTLL
jgi:hypothetical protein